MGSGEGCPQQWQTDASDGLEGPPAPKTPGSLWLSNLLLGDVFICSGCRNKIPRTGWRKRQTFIPHSSGGRKPEVKLLALRFLVRALLLACRRPPSPCDLTRKRGGSLVSLLIGTLILSDQVPIHLNYLHKGRISKYSHIEGWGFHA